LLRFDFAKTSTPLFPVPQLLGVKENLVGDSVSRCQHFLQGMLSQLDIGLSQRSHSHALIRLGHYDENYCTTGHKMPHRAHFVRVFKPVDQHLQPSIEMRAKFFPLRNKN
jgi:hypothetical protein